VIHEVDDSVRTLIRREALAGTEVDVVFDAPTKDWSSRRNAPTVDVYLYDIREDLRRREGGRFDQRDDNGRVTSRRQPPRWYKLSYLITAWTQRPEDEHRLLSAILGRLLMDDRLPPDVLSGSLADVAYPIPYTCALPPPEDRALSDVWSALGGELKPSLDLVVVAPFDYRRQIEFGPPVLEGPQLEVVTAPEGEPAKRPRRSRKGTAAEQRQGGEGAAEAESIGVAERRFPEEERIGGRHGQPGRRLRIKEIPR
jgi:Pvc16 N-terminal domain